MAGRREEEKSEKERHVLSEGGQKREKERERIRQNTRSLRREKRRKMK